MGHRLSEFEHSGSKTLTFICFHFIVAHTEVRMKKIVVLILMMAFLLAGCKTEKYKEPGIYAEIDTGKGLIVASMEFEKAPMTVANFVGLAEGTIKNSAKEPGVPYFNGLKFHRVVPGFVIQGGDPQGNGSGGPGYKFPNEIHPDLKHNAAGVLSMANAGPNTNGSQFFITLNAAPRLDGGYSVFGKVVKGLDVVKAIQKDDIIKTIKIFRVGAVAKNFKTDDASFKDIVKRAEAAIEKKLADTLAEKYPDVIKLENGLRYKILTPGKGLKPEKGTPVKVHYTLTLLDGKKIDSSLDRGEPLPFEVGMGQMIPGFDLAVQDMAKGEKRLVIIPPDLGYGEQRKGPIPENSILIFEVELVEF